MSRYLVVANQTLGGSQLAEEVRTRLASAPCTFFILVPATPSHEHLLWTEGEARSLAQERLEEGIRTFSELGAEVEGDIGDPRPVEAVLDLLRGGEEFDGILISTFPPGLSKWLKMDLVHRLQAATGLPVTHLVAEPAKTHR